jgi:hypothetical protein
MRTEPDLFDDVAYNSDDRFPSAWEYAERQSYIPRTIAERGVSMPSPFLQSRLFSVKKFAHADLLEGELMPRPASRFDFDGGYGIPKRFRYHGPELTQEHKEVLLALFDLAEGNSTDEWIEIHPRAFAVNKLGWSDSVYSREKVKQAVIDMKSAQIIYEWHCPGRETSITLVDRWEHDKKTGVLRVKFDKSILNMFAGFPTFLPFRERRQFRAGLESFMYAFVKSSDCKPKTPFTVDFFYRLSGANEVKTLAEFGRELTRVLEKLQEHKIIRSFSRSNGKVVIRKR